MDILLLGQEEVVTKGSEGEYMAGGSGAGSVGCNDV